MTGYGLKHTSYPEQKVASRRCNRIEIDEAFPHSKFILTIRETERWLPIAKFLLKAVPGFPIEKWIYGVEGFDESVFRKRFESHNAEVREYFRQRPDDLLVLYLQEGHGWKELCGFLKLPLPQAGFPHHHARKR